MSKKGILTVVSGFSGSGKGTVMCELLKAHSEYALSVSATTRDPRPGEVHGVNYFFVSKEEFRELISGNALYEYAEYSGNFYGTPKAYVDQCLSEGKDVILEIEVQGAAKIKEQFPDTVLIFVTPPTVEELLRRLTGRGSESPEKIRERMKNAVREAASMQIYDYILVNDDLDECVEALHGIISAEHRRASRNRQLIDTITEEFERIR